MKRVFKINLLVGIFMLAQVFGLAAANAGLLLRGSGDTLNPQVFSDCLLFNESGTVVGHIENKITSVGIVHSLFLQGGSSLVVTTSMDLDIPFTHPIDAQAIRSFPELANLEHAENYELMFLEGNHNATDPGIVSWVAQGRLNDYNYIEIRCAFLIDKVTGNVVKCLGCPYYLERR